MEMNNSCKTINKLRKVLRSQLVWCKENRTDGNCMRSYFDGKRDAILEIAKKFDITFRGI
jgi:hypothetical protein